MKTTYTEPVDAFAWQIPTDRPCDVYAYLDGNFISVRGKVTKDHGQVQVRVKGGGTVWMRSGSRIKMWSMAIEHNDTGIETVTLIQLEER